MCVTIRQRKNDVNSYDRILLLPTSGCQFNAFDSWSIRLCWLWYSYFSSIDSNNYVISHQPLIGTVHVITVPMFPIDHLSHSALGMGISSVKFSHPLMSNSLQSHGLQHARPHCPSLTPRVYSNSCALSRWCHPTISSSVVPFSSHLQSFPATGSFQMSQFFKSGDWSTGFSASASVLPMNIQDWFPLRWTGWISLQSKGLARSSPVPQFKSINSSALSFLHSPSLTSIHDYWKNHSCD